MALILHCEASSNPLRNIARSRPNLTHDLGGYEWKVVGGERCFWNPGSSGSSDKGIGLFTSNLADEVGFHLARHSFTARIRVYGTNYYNGAHIAGNYNYSGGSVTEQGWAIQLNNTRKLRFYDTTSWREGPTLAADEWCDIAIVNDNGSVLFYVDGVLTDTITGTALSNAGNRFALGGRRINTTDSDFAFPGGIQSFKIWNRALTHSEVKEQRIRDQRFVDVYSQAIEPIASSGTPYYQRRRMVA